VQDCDDINKSSKHDKPCCNRISPLQVLIWVEMNLAPVELPSLPPGFKISQSLSMIFAQIINLDGNGFGTPAGSQNLVEFMEHPSSKINI
jgi:hypothetical protein